MNNRITNREIKKRNRNWIYRYMSKHSVVSNPELSYQLKLSLPTVMQNTKELLEMGLIVETGELESTGGRKAKGLQVNANAKLAVGLDITKHHVGMVLTNLIGEVISYERMYEPFRKEEAYFLDVNQKIEAFLDACEVDRGHLLGIGVSIPGIIDLEKEEITDSHALDLKNVLFSNIVKYAAYPCVFLNDANAGAFAEGIREQKTFFYMSLSNTVGGAFFGGEKLLYGMNFRIGEIGHMTVIPNGKECYCGQKGCMDSYCNARILSEFAGGKLGDFFEKLKEDREEYKEVWENYISNLAIAINNIHMILDCDIVLGGYVGSYLEEYLPQIREKVYERNTFQEEGTYIRACHYKIGAAAFGAALYVIERFIEEI